MHGALFISPQRPLILQTAARKQIYAYFAFNQVLTVTLLLNQVAFSAETKDITLYLHNTHVQLPVKSWTSLRDASVVKQDLDYSCGAASLATLLNGYYRQNVTEEALLKAMHKGDAKASFDDMARALKGFGFQAKGFASSWEQLLKLKVPVIVYVRHRKEGHFAVLRGIGDRVVWLADPSLGNRTYSRAQFLELWKTRLSPEKDGLEGKFLAVLPMDPDTQVSHPFFSKFPRLQASIGLRQLTRVWKE